MTNCEAKNETKNLLATSTVRDQGDANTWITYGTCQIVNNRILSDDMRDKITFKKWYIAVNRGIINPYLRYKMPLANDCKDIESVKLLPGAILKLVNNQIYLTSFTKLAT